MNAKLKGWLKGLVMAVVVAIATALLQLLVNPTEVALWTWAQWKGALIISGVFGLIAMLTYIAKSPMPASDDCPDPVPSVSPATPAPAGIPPVQKQRDATASGQDPPK
jgi:hypothetical protein